MTARDWMDIILLLANVVFGIFCWFIKTEWGRIVGDIKDTRVRCDELEKEQNLQRVIMPANYVTKSEHLISETRIITAIDRLTDKIDGLISQQFNREGA